ncbi:hypothetical protein C3B79_3754 [Aeromonas hydrophila]|nr:hypothetical protein C3B79_3754 [Aeromonas hydrophila]
MISILLINFELIDKGDVSLVFILLTKTFLALFSVLVACSAEVQIALSSRISACPYREG